MRPSSSPAVAAVLEGGYKLEWGTWLAALVEGHANPDAQHDR
jgi:hypothetical protein